MKKIAGIFFAAALVMSLCVPAFAAGETGAQTDLTFTYWNFGFTERLKHGLIIMPGMASTCAGQQPDNVLENDNFRLFSTCFCPRFSY